MENKSYSLEEIEEKKHQEKLETTQFKNILYKKYFNHELIPDILDGKYILKENNTIYQFEPEDYNQCNVTVIEDGKMIKTYKNSNIIDERVNGSLLPNFSEFLIYIPHSLEISNK